MLICIIKKSFCNMNHNYKYNKRCAKWIYYSALKHIYVPDKHLKQASRSIKDICYNGVQVSNLMCNSMSDKPDLVFGPLA